jgi:UDP-N-acetylmuramoyl-L-alanyl-D-glutamate--2,6-diaminopimelate ligase
LRTLKDILYRTGLMEVQGDTSQAIDNIAFDSRLVLPGCLFVAVRGTQTDGHNYISQAIEKGAVAIVCEEFPEAMPQAVSFIKVKNSAIALGLIAANFYGNSSQSLKVIGVTGTNGKTTIATLLYQLFGGLGYQCGLLSTIANYIGSRKMPATHTTPDALQLNTMLETMINEGVTHCFMEVSSHAIAQHRVAGIEFSGGIFTNLSHDHLDYHKTFDEYRDAKKKFFDELPASAFALSNADDRNGQIMLQNTHAKKHYYGLKNMADFRCRILENRFDGLQLGIDGLDTWFRLVGPFNAYNLLAVYATAVLLGEQKEKILTSLSGISPVEGRFDHFISPVGITAIVDYAHTPDALENVLKTIAVVRTGNEQVITVVGAGGNRDKTKRPIMARIACDNSNRVILTSDNPRFEEPEAIVEEMKKGVPVDKKKNTLAIVNREEAIRTACALAQKGDIVLVAGKGHEKYQEIKGIKHPFDDKEILMDLLATENTENNKNKS